MPFGAKKGKNLNLDCLTLDMEVTVLTCCGLVFQGSIRNDDHARASYGCPVVFPAMTMDYGYAKEENKEDDKECCKKDDKKEHCPKPIEVDVEVKCDNKPEFICLELTCIVGNICCPPNGGTGGQALVLPIRNDSNDTPLFAIGQTVLISLDEIAAIGPQRPCMAD